MTHLSGIKTEAIQPMKIRARKPTGMRRKQRRKPSLWIARHLDVLTQDKARDVIRNLRNLFIAPHHGSRSIRSAGATTSNGGIISLLWPRKGPVYPLRKPVFVRYQLHPAGVEVRNAAFEIIPGLHGSAETEEAALVQLANNLHRLVLKHHNLPPHRKNAENEEISTKLNALIDWERYHELNPVEQPFWGRVVRHRADGGIDIHWFLGPGDIRNRETTLQGKSVSPHLRSLQPGDWFYGAGKALPNKIKWTSRPVKVPDPEDRTEVRKAWDRIPRKILTDPDTWPEPMTK